MGSSTQVTRALDWNADRGNVHAAHGLADWDVFGQQRPVMIHRDGDQLPGHDVGAVTTGLRLIDQASRHDLAVRPR